MALLSFPLHRMWLLAPTAKKGGKQEREKKRWIERIPMHNTSFLHKINPNKMITSKEGQIWLNSLMNWEKINRKVVKSRDQNSKIRGLLNSCKKIILKPYINKSWPMSKVGQQQLSQPTLCLLVSSKVIHNLNIRGS